MRLFDLSIREVSSSLARPVGSPEAPERRRAGLLLRLRDAEGNVGLGEASPLPGFSQDSLASCRTALAGLDTRDLADCFDDPGPESVLAALARARRLLDPSLPAAAFALETALLDLVCRRERRSPFELLGRPALPRVELNAVLDATLPEARERALDLIGQGYTTLKLKFGSRWEPALDTLTHLRQRGGIQLRADANRKLGAEALECALPRMVALGLEFLEEPCAPELWPSLPATRPPIALDETLGSASSEQLPALLRQAHADVIVLKPMALGGFSECLRLADAAHTTGCAVVVTHLFDGPVALAAASALACVVQSPRLAAGLAPHAGLGAWPRAPQACVPPPSGLGRGIDPGSFCTGISPIDYWQELGD